jgi:hypothetical protein
MTGFISLDWFGGSAAHYRGFGLRSIVLGSDTHEADRTFTREVFGRDEVGTVHTGDPDILRWLLLEAR